MRIPLPKEYYKITDIGYKGKKIRTYRFGIGPKKVLSLPGFPHSGLIYLYFLIQYDLTKVQFITLDLPGWIGNTSNYFEDESYDEELVIDIVSTVIEKYNLKDFGLIGHSFGSSIATRIVGLNKYDISKLALISPVLRGTEVKDRRWMLTLINNLKVYSYLKFHIHHRYHLYKARLKLMGIDVQILDDYLDLINKSDPKILLESLNKLFTSNYDHYLKEFDPKKILIASSKDEDPFFRHQASILRRELKDENTLYLHGNHEDFIIEPKKESVKEIMKFLLS